MLQGDMMSATIVHENKTASLFPDSSVVERRSVKPLVGGSNPSQGAILMRV